MTATMRVRALGLAACAVLCLTLGAAAARADDASINYETETLKAYEGQLDSGQIASVVVNKRLRSLRVTLKSGQHVKARYNAHQEPAMVSALRAKNVPVSILSKAEAEKEAKAVPRHHKLRYIVGGAVIVVVLILAGIVLFIRRKRQEAE
jgi:hypothetical protein